MIKKITSLLAVAGMTLLLSACYTPEMTNTKRSGVEEMLLSKAADTAAIKFIPQKFLAGKKVFLDTSNLDAIDKGYIIGMVQIHLAEEGAKMLTDKLKADIIVLIYSGASGTDSDDFMIGVPSIPIPIPLAGTVQTPQIALIKEVKQTGVCKLILDGKDARSDRLLFSQTNIIGSSYYNRWSVMGVNFSLKDIYDIKQHHAGISVKTARSKVNS